MKTEIAFIPGRSGAMKAPLSIPHAANARLTKITI